MYQMYQVEIDQVSPGICTQILFHQPRRLKRRHSWMVIVSMMIAVVIAMFIYVYLLSYHHDSFYNAQNRWVFLLVYYSLGMGTIRKLMNLGMAASTGHLDSAAQPKSAKCTAAKLRFPKGGCQTPGDDSFGGGYKLYSPIFVDDHNPQTANPSLDQPRILNTGQLENSLASNHQT